MANEKCRFDKPVEYTLEITAADQAGFIASCGQPEWVTACLLALQEQVKAAEIWKARYEAFRARLDDDELASQVAETDKNPHRSVIARAAGIYDYRKALRGEEVKGD